MDESSGVWAGAMGCATGCGVGAVEGSDVKKCFFVDIFTKSHILCGYGSVIQVIEKAASCGAFAGIAWAVGGGFLGDGFGDGGGFGGE